MSISRGYSYKCVGSLTGRLGLVERKQSYNLGQKLSYSSFGDKPNILTLIQHISNIYTIYQKEYSDDEDLAKEFQRLKVDLLIGKFSFKALKIVSVQLDSDRRYMSIDIDPMDCTVITSFAKMLINELRRSSYFLESCYSTYRDDKSYIDYMSTISNWKEISYLIRIDCLNSLMSLSRSRLLSKVKEILYDNHLFHIISSFCNIEILNSSGELVSHNSRGIPPLTFISDVLFNIYLDDLDRQIDEKYPCIKYVRYDSELIIAFSIWEKAKVKSFVDVFNEICININLCTPLLEKAYRGSSAIPFKFGMISVNKEGSIEIGQNG